MPETRNLEIAKRYISRLSDGAGADELESFFAPDAEQEEFPNRLMPKGAKRDRQAMREARAARRFSAPNGSSCSTPWRATGTSLWRWCGPGRSVPPPVLSRPVRRCARDSRCSWNSATAASSVSGTTTASIPGESGPHPTLNPEHT